MDLSQLGRRFDEALNAAARAWTSWDTHAIEVALLTARACVLARDINDASLVGASPEEALEVFIGEDSSPQETLAEFREALTYWQAREHQGDVVRERVRQLRGLIESWETLFGG